MAESVFSKGHRTDVRPARHTESTYAFLDRCGKSGCDAIRREIQRWFEHYSESHQGALLRRLRADEFGSAFFELYLHELLRRLGLHPLVEPQRWQRRPDFVCRMADWCLAIEASVVTGESREAGGRRAVLNVVYDAMNQVPSPDYFFHVEECAVKGPEQPSLSAITAFLLERIQSVDYDELALLEQQGLDSLPKWVLESERIRLVVRPIPKHSARSKAGVRPIGIYPMEGGWVTTRESIRRRLSEKAKKLKLSGVPLVLAINLLTKWGSDDDDVLDALYGTERVLVDVATGKARPSRGRDGFFVGPKGPINTRVSAVLVTSVHPWTAARAGIDLWLNPWSKKPLADGVLPFRVRRITNGRVVVENGLHPGQLLGLSDTWPEECD